MRAPRAPKIDADVPFEAPVEMPASRAFISIKRTPELEIAFGTRIRAARIAAKMSQVDLGSAVGISFQQVQKYEKGVDRIAASTLQKVSTILGVHPGWFFGDEMPAPFGNISDARVAMKAGAVLQQIRDPRVLKQLLALAGELAKTEVAVEPSGSAADEAP